MSRIINLSTLRKQNARAEKRRAAGANAVKHGLTKAERARADVAVQKASAYLDAHKRETPE